MICELFLFREELGDENYLVSFWQPLGLRRRQDVEAIYGALHFE